MSLVQSLSHKTRRIPLQTIVIHPSTILARPYRHIVVHNRYCECSYLFTMFCFSVYVTLLLPALPTLISANCAACDSYTSALASCGSGINVTAVGTKTDSSTIHCMCTSKSSVTDMNACQACIEADPSTDLLPGVLFAWTTTCQADVQFGDKQAALCWESQPSNAIPCFSRGAGGGSTGGSTNDGSDVTTEGASTAATGSTSR